MIRIFNRYVSPKGVLLPALEALLITSAFLCGLKLRFWSSDRDFYSYIQAPEFAWQICTFVVVFQLCFYYSDLYNPSRIRRRSEQWISLGQALGAGCLLLGLLYFVVPDLLIGRGVFFISILLVPLFMTLNRLALDATWHMAAPPQNVLILGTGDLARTVAAELLRRDDLSLALAGFLEPNIGRDAGPSQLCGRPVFGNSADLMLTATQQNVERIIVAMEDRRGALPTRELVRLKVQGIRVEDAHSTLASLSGRVWLRTIQPSWFVFSDGFHRSKVTSIVKRAVDLSCGFVGLVLSLPIMFVVAFLIRLDSKGDVIYRQTRVGLGGRPFEVLKFRSMCLDAESANGAQWASKDDPRVTTIGKILRKYRFDELPQFVNVIRGDMSFVGPRPERPVFVEQLREKISYYDERHSVRPGLTGWAQVEFTYGASIDDAYRKLEYDLFYLKNMSIFFDCAIILKTIRIVLTGQGGR